MEADISIWRKPGHFYFALTLSSRSLDTTANPRHRRHRHIGPSRGETSKVSSFAKAQASYVLPEIHPAVQPEISYCWRLYETPQP